MFNSGWPFDASATAAAFSAIATAIAAFAAWIGPRSAAKLAEVMRQKSEVANERRRMKLWVFTTLIQERAAYYSSEGVKAFNLIDVVYNESRTVRDAWADFHSAMDTNNNVPDHAKQEKFRFLLSRMAVEIGLADQLRADDLNRVYYPNALAEEEHVRSLERKSAIDRLSAKSTPAANTATPTSSLSSDYPPPPSQP